VHLAPPLTPPRHSLREWGESIVIRRTHRRDAR
jgi:hypothetical protein